MKISRRRSESAHLMSFCAFEDVQTAPPILPQNALMAADEFMYVIGIRSLRPSAVSSA